MSDELEETSIDIPLATLNQTPAKHAGPIGRLQTIKNMMAKHYTPTNGGPTKLKADPRGAFVSLSTDTRNPKTGDASSGAWSNPELLSSLDNQLVSVCNSVPRVYNREDAFIDYATKRVMVNELSADVFHTSDRTIQATDSRSASGVTCGVWAERLSPATTTVNLFVGFKRGNTWIRTPQVLYAPTEADPTLTMAKVVEDEDGAHFWVVHNCLVSGENLFRVHLFDLDGVELDINEDQDKIWLTEPGYWDITKRFGGGILLAQPLFNAGSADGVFVTQYTQTLGVIAESGGSDTGVHCRGPLAWITNKVDAAYYLATVGQGSGAGGKLWGYRFNQPTPSPHVHEYNFNVNIPGDGFPDSLVGYTKFNNDPDATTLDMIIAYTVLPLSAQTAGPLFDPALRYFQVYSCTFANVVTFIKQGNSVCLVSRAFEHDGEYYAMTYYQSGSGLSVTETTQTVTWTSGDYMTGQREQPIKVAAGDYSGGSPQSFPGHAPGSGVNIVTSAARASVNILGTGTPDSVSLVSGTPNYPSRQALKWTFQNMSGLTLNMVTSMLKILSASIPTANQEWKIFDFDAGTKTVYTEIISLNGGSTNVGNFSTAGTAEIFAMTTYFIDLFQVYSDDWLEHLRNGTMTISGASAPNNGAKTIAWIVMGSFGPVGEFTGPIAISIITASEVTEAAAFTAEITTVFDDTWSFANGNFSNVLSTVPHKLTVKGSEFTVNGNDYTNNGEYAIASVASASVIGTDGSIPSFPHAYSSPLPTASILLPTDVEEFTFKLQSLTLDYTFNNALVFVQAATNSENNGLYKISFLDVTNGTFIAKPADGRTGQRSESFPSDVVITIFFVNNVQPVFQPKWFITPLFDCETAHVGRFEDGLAYSDWRYEGDDLEGPNNFPLHVSSVYAIANAIQFALPYRARSFTAGQPLVAPPNQVADAAVNVVESTVGVKVFKIAQKFGVSSAMLNELFLPGPLTSVFTSSGFREQGINVAPEAPFIVSQQTESDDLHLTPNTSHQLVVTYEVTDENGNRIFCPPSPPLDYVLTGTNNAITYGGRLPFPLDTDGVAISKHFGLTNHRIVGITLERTSYQGGLPTIQHYKITDDLNVNGLAPVSDLNPSGFSFPDEFTWNYIDQNPDVNVLSSEVLYTDKGFLPRFPAPPSRFSATWMNRPWLPSYDGSLGCGGEFEEGDAPWFFPGFRFTFGNDKAVACAPMGSVLVVGCEGSMWYIPQPSAFPNAGGQNGKLPTPIELTKIKSGCTGFMLPVDGGVVYSSTLGGLWMITTNLENVYLSRDIQDQLATGVNDVTALQIDKNNRLHVATGTDQLFTFDQVVQTWYNWSLPTATAKFLSTIDGELAFQDNHRIFRYDPAQFIDDVDGDLLPILWRIKFAAFNFGGVRRFKHCWAFQILGEYHGPHRLFAVIGYPDDNYESDSIRGPFVPSADDPYLVEVNPSLEDASTFTLELYNDFEGVDEPGESASIELISAAIGVESGMAQTTRRLT